MIAKLEIICTGAGATAAYGLDNLCAGILDSIKGAVHVMAKLWSCINTREEASKEEESLEVAEAAEAAVVAENLAQVAEATKALDTHPQSQDNAGTVSESQEFSRLCFPTPTLGQVRLGGLKKQLCWSTP